MRQVTLVLAVGGKTAGRGGSETFYSALFYFSNFETCKLTKFFLVIKSLLNALTLTPKALKKYEIKKTLQKC